MIMRFSSRSVSLLAAATSLLTTLDYVSATADYSNFTPASVPNLTFADTGSMLSTAQETLCMANNDCIKTTFCCSSYSCVNPRTCLHGNKTELDVCDYNFECLSRCCVKGMCNHILECYSQCESNQDCVGKTI